MHTRDAFERALELPSKKPATFSIICRASSGVMGRWQSGCHRAIVYVLHYSGLGLSRTDRIRITESLQ